MTAPDRITVTFDNWRNPNAGAAYKNDAGETAYVRADLARPTTLAEALVSKEAATAREVFENYGSKAKEAIDYMEQLLLAALRAIGEGRNG